MLFTGHGVKLPPERRQRLEQSARSVCERGVIDPIQRRSHARDRPRVQILGVNGKTTAGRLDRYGAAPAVGVGDRKAGAISRVDGGIQQGSDQRM
jgi:hypothetical protein